MGQICYIKMAQYHSGRGKKRVILDGRNPADILAWEGFIQSSIKEKHGDIGVEHWRGRHPYTYRKLEEMRECTRTRTSRLSIRASR